MASSFKNTRGQGTLELILAVTILILMAFCGLQIASLIKTEFKHDYISKNPDSNQTQSQTIEKSVFLNRGIILTESDSMKKSLAQMQNAGWRFVDKLGGDSELLRLRNGDQTMVLSKGIGVIICSKNCWPE